MCDLVMPTCVQPCVASALPPTSLSRSMRRRQRLRRTAVLQSKSETGCFLQVLQECGFGSDMTVANLQLATLDMHAVVPDSATPPDGDILARIRAA
eukprot:3688071-Amphidinium_carterae.1